MIQVAKQFKFEASHRLFNYIGSCSNTHGHSYLVEVTVAHADLDKYIYADELDSLDMVVDFGIIKKIIGSWIQDNWDHSMLLNSKDVEMIKVMSEQLQRFYIFQGSNPTAEIMALFLLYRDWFPKGSLFKVREVKVWETDTSYATASLTELISENNYDSEQAIKCY